MNERTTHSPESLPSSWSAAWFSFLSPSSLLQDAAIPLTSWEHHDTKQTMAALTLWLVYVTGIVTVTVWWAPRHGPWLQISFPTF